MRRRSTATPRLPSRARITSFWLDESGATAIEYGLLVSMIGAILISFLLTGGSLSGLWDRIVGAVMPALAGGG